MVGVPTVPVELCEGLSPAVVGGEAAEGQPGGDGRGVQPRWEGTWGVVPKIANLRNHYGVDTYANT